MNKRRNILICPLEWGLGHAARMIPVARKLQEMGNNIIVASGNEHLALFRAELPGLKYINFSGFKPSYSRYLPQYLVILIKTPFFLFHIIKEHIKLKRIIREYSIDIVISDNRPGLWNKNIVTVYVTHMPRIPFPKPFRFLEPAGILLHRSFIRLYSLCFIPDLPGDLNLSGRLSHGIKLTENVRYTGILSRFISEEPHLHDHGKFQHVIILSGPEPQREMLKVKLTGILRKQETAAVFLEGKPDKTTETSGSGNILCYNHLTSPEMKEMIMGSKSIICRSGYTTIMDLISLNRAALLIPTPGQTEQEYLALYLAEKGWFTTISQNEIKGELPFHQADALWPPEIVEQSKILLSAALRELMQKADKSN